MSLPLSSSQIQSDEVDAYEYAFSSRFLCKSGLFSTSIFQERININELRNPIKIENRISDPSNDEII